MERKKLIGIVASVVCMAMFAGCGSEKDKVESAPHWSHKACVEEIVSELDLREYTYMAKQIETSESVSGDDEVYCFDIIVSDGAGEYRYYCYAVVDGDEVMYVDCDEWKN